MFHDPPERKAQTLSLQLPERSAGTTRRLRRLALLILLGTSLIVLGGCGSDNEFERLAMPKPATVEGEHTLALWQGAWIAALITGAVVWGLIFYAIWKFRRRSDDEVPVQTRYNLPLEIFYTIFPIIMVVVFFSHTVRVQNLVLNDEDVQPTNTVYVVGQQWSWTFNYPESFKNPETGEMVNIYTSGTGRDIPTLVVPVDETTRFELRSPDVIHDFGVPGFLIKMDVMPGQKNHFQVTPKVEGATYDGKCYELCGTYHSRMLFSVHVVNEADYQKYLADQFAKGFYSDQPVCGGKYSTTQVGLDVEESQIQEVCQ
ncbi:cytochrome c oxidase subunit II [soil metagenome]